MDANEQRARKLLAAEYERDGLLDLADAVRHEPQCLSAYEDCAIRVISAALRSQGQAVAVEWKPIAEAPRNGKYILAVEADGVSPPYVTCWRTFRDGFGNQHTGFIESDSGELGPYPCEPTHWAELPSTAAIARPANKEQP